MLKNKKQLKNWIKSKIISRIRVENKDKYA